MRVHIDIETASTEDIKKTTTDRYVHAPGFDVLLIAYSIGDYAINLWDATEDPRLPEPLADLFADSDVIFHGYNVGGFERKALNRFFRLRRLPFYLDIRRFKDTMIEAYYAAFAKGLKDVGKQMLMPQDQQKLKGGTRLINKFCSPRKLSKNNPAEWWTPADAPEDWELFKAYNIGDVESERAIYSRLISWGIHVPQWVWEQWYADQEMNDYGVPIDPQALNGAQKILASETRRLHGHLKRMTMLDNPNSRDQMLGWVRSHGLPNMPDLQAQTIRDIVEQLQDPFDEIHDQSLPDVLLDVLQSKSQLAKTAPKKFAAMARAINPNDRIEGMFQLGGASRTFRDASRIINLQNLARGSAGDPEALVECVALGDRDFLETVWGPDIMDLLSSSVRGMITAPPGKSLIVADLASIESVVLAWVSGCQTIIDMFKQGKDTYRAFAAEYYRKPYDQVTKEERFFCKPPVLGAGYRLSGSGLDGTGGLVAYAAQYGITMTPEEGNAMIAMFRRQYWEIPAMWDALDATVQKVVNNKIDITGAVPTGRCWFWLEGPFLKVRLPSGRDLHYFEPRIEANDWGKPGLTYMGVNQYTQQWERISTHSGKIIENLIQGIARDVFWNGVMLALKQGLNLFGRVHDEAIGDEQEQEAEEKLRILIECMTTLPKWADEDLILGADGFITKRYKKG